MTERVPGTAPVNEPAARGIGERHGNTIRLYRLHPWLWLIPALTLLIPFFIIPLGILARNSVYRDDPTALLVADFTVGNYTRMLTDPYYADVFTNSLWIAFSVGVIALLVSYPFAYYVVRWAGRSRKLLIWAVYMPLIVSVIVRVFGWIVITADSGLINNLLVGIGIVDQPARILYAVGGMMIGLTHRYLPLMVLPLVNAMAKIDPALLTASAGLGAGRIRTFALVVIPLSIPGMVAGFQLVFAGVLSDYVLPNLMGTTRFRMLAPAIYDEAIGNVSWASAAAMAVVMIVIVVAVLLITNVLFRRFAPWARTL